MYAIQVFAGGAIVVVGVVIFVQMVKLQLFLMSNWCVKCVRCRAELPKWFHCLRIIRWPNSCLNSSSKMLKTNEAHANRRKYKENEMNPHRYADTPRQLCQDNLRLRHGAFVFPTRCTTRKCEKRMARTQMAIIKVNDEVWTSPIHPQRV